MGKLGKEEPGRGRRPQPAVQGRESQQVLQDRGERASGQSQAHPFCCSCGRVGCVCGSSDRGRILRLLLHGDARGFGVVILGFREDE